MYAEARMRPMFAAALALASVVAASGQTRTQVVMLGTGTPRPEPEHSGPATAIVVNGSAYLVDVGRGIVRRAAAGRSRKGSLRLRPTNYAPHSSPTCTRITRSAIRI
jgi:hypothetical protein